MLSRIVERIFVPQARQSVRFMNAPVDATLIREAMDLHGEFRLKARGGSMQPAIRDGEVLNVVPVKPEDVRMGDIVFTVYQDRGYVIHRVIRWHHPSDQLWTKGDSLDGLDPPISSNSILGRVQWHAFEGMVIRLDRGIMKACAPLLAIWSMGALFFSKPVAALFNVWGRTRAVGRNICRASRVPAWFATRLLVALSRRRCE